MYFYNIFSSLHNLCKYNVTKESEKEREGERNSLREREQEIGGSI
jgi:hypothetical protein